jgi:hypothetical protein
MTLFESTVESVMSHSPAEKTRSAPSEPSVVIALERSTRVTIDPETGTNDETRSLKLRMDWRFLAVVIVAFLLLVVVDPAFLELAEKAIHDLLSAVFHKLAKPLLAFP